VLANSIEVLQGITTIFNEHEEKRKYEKIAIPYTKEIYFREKPFSC
jgi:hypothetical protein